jgi:N-ethylmaleimide reductase
MDFFLSYLSCIYSCCLLLVAVIVGIVVLQYIHIMSSSTSHHCSSTTTRRVVSQLFAPLQVGTIGTLQHRVVLAPLTRNRADEPSLSPSAALAVQYYRQRASLGGLLISEATNISPESLAYPSTPGIWSREQVQGWKNVTSAVHQKGAFFVCQLWHTGRVAHPDFARHIAVQNSGYIPCVSASAVPITNRRGELAKTVTYDGTVVSHGIPRALERDEIPRLCHDYAHAAANAKLAGFDGVELHAAHGYLIDQFLNNGVNQRTDDYGGSPENRCRLLTQAIEAILTVWPSSKVGVRLSPHQANIGGNTYYGCQDSDPDLIYTHAVQTLSRYNLAYLLLTEPRWVGKHDASPETDPGFAMPLTNLQKYRSHYNGILIGAGGFTPTSSFQVMANNSSSPSYDALAFGRWFISNPDLPERLYQFHEYQANKIINLQQQHSSSNTASSSPLPPLLNRYNRDTFYTQSAEGYIDYPSLDYNNGNDNNENPDHEGTKLCKYPLIDQSTVGTSLETATEMVKSKL